MADAVEAGWHGHDYQARFFWYHASKLRDPEHSYVVEVSYEANGPKAFDDVIVRYDPPRPSSSFDRISVDHHQIKFHVAGGGRFGYADLIDPAFIGATAVSLLERLVEAKKNAPPNSAFTLVTVDRIADDDPLEFVVSNVDYSLRFDRLFSGGDRSRFGKVRKLWRDHLKVSDDELREILRGLHIASSQRSLDQLREDVNLSFRSVGLVTCASTVEFRFDSAARQLKIKGRNRFTRDDFEGLCAEEGWIREPAPRNIRSVVLRSFEDGPGNRLDAPVENTLSLLGHFDSRQLSPGSEWADVQTLTESFLVQQKSKEGPIRLYLETHASIAFLAGTVIGLKSGIPVELMQKGRRPHLVWSPNDGFDGPEPVATHEKVGGGDDVALVVSASREAITDVREYLLRKCPHVGRIVHTVPAGGIGHTSIAGGAHAARFADSAAEAVRKLKPQIGSRIHVFVSGPNSLSFFLGQHREALGPCIFYEFDFGRVVDGSYHPTFRIG